MSGLATVIIPVLNRYDLLERAIGSLGEVERLIIIDNGDNLGDEMAKAYRAALDAGKNTTDPVLTNFKTKFTVDWSPFLGKKWTDAGDTATEKR